MSIKYIAKNGVTRASNSFETAGRPKCIFALPVARRQWTSHYRLRVKDSGTTRLLALFGFLLKMTNNI